MKQQKLAGRLKILAVLTGILGVLFFGGAIWLKLYLEFGAVSIAFTCITAVFCYGILYQFWKVCVEIGKDNSFSLENAASFRKMKSLALVMGASYLIRFICFFITGDLPSEFFYLYPPFMLALSLIFAGLCGALSLLVQNAYEVKQENDLTI